MLETFEAKGWELLRTNASGSHRVRKEKPLDEQLEDRCWCILYLLGYQNLSIGRKFTIDLTAKSDGPAKQIDVFAYDDSSVVVLECKSSKKRQKKHLGDAIHEFAGARKQIANTIRKKFGEDFDKPIIWGLVTKNIEWSEADLKRAEECNINVIRDTDVAYYAELSRRIGRAARYQFQAEFLKKSRALSDVNVFALRTKLAGEPVYSFFAPANKILPIAFVNHRDLRDPEASPSYQRMVQKSRLRKIGEYLKSGGYFPNSIIVNFHEEVVFKQLKPADADGITAGILTLPNKYKSLMVIDGQHRLYGYTQPELESPPDLQFLAFEGITVQQETKLFSDINYEQKTVSRSVRRQVFETSGCLT